MIKLCLDELKTDNTGSGFSNYIGQDIKNDQDIAGNMSEMRSQIKKVNHCAYKKHF